MTTLHRREDRRRSRSDSPDAGAAAEKATSGRVDFGQLEALRHVSIVAHNEYPLAHVQREQLLRREDCDEDGPICMCTRPSDDEVKHSATTPRRCDDVSCLNFATYVECNDNCPAARFCCNRRLQHPERFPQLEPFMTEHKGYGVRTCEDIVQASVVGEYVGEIIDQKELARRLKSIPRHELNFYYLLLSPGIYIDARNKGSFTRFVNHSCEPNCKTEKWTVNGETRIAVVALRDIDDGEELTFDYQWKALGSRQIKCYCDAPTCKGVIGSEGDVVKDESSKGFFREPTIEEIGAALIDRRVRIFNSQDDTAGFSIATIIGYDDTNDKYEVEYETRQTDGYEDGDSVNDDNMTRSISLQENGWQIYSTPEDQNTNEVFSIPKRRVSDVVGTSSVEASPLAPGSTASPVSNVTSATTTLSISPNESERQGHENDTQAAKPRSNKIFVKYIPREYDERAFRRLFAERRRPGKPFGAQDDRSSQDDGVVSIDMFFFFDDNTGWALVELKSPELAEAFRDKLHNRPLAGKTLRVFVAGQNELDSFHRGKTKVTIRTQELKSKEAAGAPSAESENVSDKKELDEHRPPYPFGRKINWLVSENEVDESVSQRAGMSASLEETLRIKFVKGILHIAKRLHLDRGDATSAILALHRYFTFHPMTINVEFHAAAMLHLFLKAHSRNVSWKDFVNEVYNEKYQTSGSDHSLPSDCDKFRVLERHLIAAENDLLDGLCFDLSGEDPYALLDMLTTAKNRRKLFAGVAKSSSLINSTPPPDVQREAKHLVAETLRLRIWMHLPVECVVLSIAYLGSAVVEAFKNRSVSSNGLLRVPSIPEYLPRLDPIKNQLEALMLLECSTSICTSLKDRWVRLEKNQKNASGSKPLGDEEFDTERFAVSREKNVPINELIARLLSGWINVPSSTATTSISPEYFSHRGSSSEFITFASFGNPLVHSGPSQHAESNVSATDRRGKDVSISAASIFLKNGVARGSSNARTSSKSVTPSVERLRTTDIRNIESIRKLQYLGSVAQECRCDLAGTSVYMQPWPYREGESTFSNSRGLAGGAAREVSTALTLHAMLPDRFLKLSGIVFPEEKKDQRSGASSGASGEEDAMMADMLATATSSSGSRSSSSPPALDQLDLKKHYLAFEQPLHMYSGIFEAKIGLPLRLRKKAIYDMLTALGALHDRNYVHRFVAPSHLFVFKDGVKLGGYHSVRKTASVKSEDGSSVTAYKMNERERKEQALGSCLAVTAPEILLGETVYTWRSDIWSAGCVTLAILLDRVPFLQGQQVGQQLDLIFRLCGTPKGVWEEGVSLPLYRMYRPKHDYKARVRKTLLEEKEKYPEFPADAIEVLEAMLQLDPTKRSNTRRILEMRFFDDTRWEEERATRDHSVFDFSGLAPSFPVQKKKLLQHLKSKKRHSSSAASSSHRSSSKPAKASSSSRSSSSHRHRHKRALSMDEPDSRSVRRSKRSSRDGDMDMDDVPLPASFQPNVVSVAEEGDESSSDHMSRSAAQPRREKLGWGMGLIASIESDKQTPSP